MNGGGPEVYPVASRKSFFSRFRLVYRRSSALLKCAVLATIVLSTVALATLYVGIDQYKTENERLRAEAAALERDNQRLEDNLDQMGTVQSVKRIAEEELGLVEPGSTFFEAVITDQD